MTTKLEKVDYLRFISEDDWLWKTNEDWKSIMDSEIFGPLCALFARFGASKLVERWKWREIGTENTIPQ